MKNQPNVPIPANLSSRDNKTKRKHCIQCDRHRHLKFFFDAYAGGLRDICVDCRKRNSSSAKAPSVKQKATVREKEREKVVLWDTFLKPHKSRCAACGYNKHTYLLNFHHRDPSAKKFDVYTCKTKAFTIDNRNLVYAEIQKCIVFCKNCHSDFHYQYGMKDFTEEDLAKFIKEENDEHQN